VDYSTISAEELVLTCFQSGNELAWTEFVRRFQPLIARVVLRVARQWGESSRQTIDDLIQETYLKLCADRLQLLQTFRSTHEDAIYGYIKVFTANLVHDHFKGMRSKKRGGETATASIDGEDLDRLPQVSTSAAALLERGILIQQIDSCLREVSSGPDSIRDRKIFWLYYRTGLAASAIAAFPTIGLSTKGVESTLLRLTRQVRRRLVTQEPQCSPKDSLGKAIPPADAL
jgi:RNA polymerase sigma-70 factor (ECF subfamily)